MNNSGIYDAVIAGVGGTVQATASTNTALVAFADRADILATAVDSLIAIIPGGVTASQMTLMGEVVSGLVANRFLGDFSGGSHPDYTGMAIEIVRLYTEMETQLQNVPVPSVIANTHVADVATLRATPALIPAGTIYLDCHTYAGIGGGEIYWDAASVKADDNGTCFQVAGVPVGRWMRSNAASDPICVDWFGANPNFNPGTLVGTNSTVAIQAAVAYMMANPNKLAMRFGKGCYRLDQPIIVRDNWTIEGTGLWSTQIWGSAAGVFILGNPAAVPPHIYCQGITIRDLWIIGGAGIGGSAIEVPHCLLHFVINVACTGGYDYAFKCSIPGSLGQDAALQWGDLSMYSTMSQDILGAPWAMPVNYFYNDGYFNACKMRFEIRRSTGVGITCIGEYAGADYSEITGSCQECGQAVSLLNVGKLIFRNFYSEGDGAIPIVCTTSRPIFRDGGSGVVSLIGCQDTQFDSWQGPYTEDANTSGTRTTNSAICPIGRVNNSAVMLGAAESANFDADRRFDLPGYGDTDPTNIALNGDFCRWTSPTIVAGFISNYTATKCGDGCVDTTRTSYAPNCALFEAVGGTLFVMYLVAAPVQLFLGAQISFNFKAKTDPGHTVGFAVGPQNELRLYGDEARKMPCENGFDNYMITARVTQDMLDHGIMLTLGSSGHTPLYVSEISCCYGSIVPRYYERAHRCPQASAELNPSGNLTYYVSSVPVAATDPVFGAAWIDGDVALLKNSTQSVTQGGVPYTLTGWKRIGAAWVPMYVFTALAATDIHFLDISQQDVSVANTPLLADAATTVLQVTVPTLAVSSTYIATIGMRLVLWKDDDLTISGTIDLCTDILIVTNGAGVPTTSLIGTQYPDVYRLPATLPNASLSLALAAQGFYVQATRSPGIDSLAKTRVWIHRFEKLELA